MFDFGFVWLLEGEVAPKMFERPCWWEELYGHAAAADPHPGLGAVGEAVVEEAGVERDPFVASLKDGPFRALGPATCRAAMALQSEALFSGGSAFAGASSPPQQGSAPSGQASLETGMNILRLITPRIEREILN